MFERKTGDIEFQRDCILLANSSGVPYEQIEMVVRAVAAQSTHLTHHVPLHIESLLHNNWSFQFVQPKDRVAWLHTNPIECEQGCLKKFEEALAKAGMK